MPQPWRCSPTTLRAPCIPRLRTRSQHAVEALIPQWGISPPGDFCRISCDLKKNVLGEFLLFDKYFFASTFLGTTGTGPDWMLRRCGPPLSNHGALLRLPHLLIVFAMIAGEMLPLLLDHIAALERHSAALPPAVLYPLILQNLLLLVTFPAAPHCLLPFLPW